MHLKFALALSAVLLTGCSAIASKTNSLSDERIVSLSAGTIGVSPGDLSLIDRRTEGVNTYARVKTKAGVSYACTINGGNLLSFGMTNPPVCNRN